VRILERDDAASEPRSRPGWWPRWYELLPEAVLIVGLTTFLIDETNAATSAFASTKALTLMALATIGWLVGRVVVARFVPWPWLRLAGFGVAAVVALAVVVLPAYDNDTVVEAFPGSAPVAPESDDAGAPAPPTETTEPEVPVRFRVGAFRGIDHRAEGTVALYRHPDGRFVVGLEDFDIQPGPDYDLYLVPGDDRDGLDGGVRLDDLRGNRGTQFYDVPEGLDLADGTWTVLVWCETFAVPIANATPA
jgi:hypothetical protein